MTYKPSLQLKVTGFIPLDNVTADMLEHVTSYEFIKEFVNSCSSRYSESEIRSALSGIRQEIIRVQSAVKIATAAVNKELSNA